MSRVWGWVGIGLGALGCGGNAVASGARGEEGSEAAGRGSGGGSLGGDSSLGGGAAIAGIPSTDGIVSVRPRIGGPTPEGDGRLPDIPETIVGRPVIGWDLCAGDGEGLASSKTECADCAASRGSEFLVAEHTLEDVPIASLRPQLYFYFDPPQGAQALWFDVAWLSGPRVAELSVWETDTLCEPRNVGRLFDLQPLLQGAPGEWFSACVPLEEARKLRGLGLRLGAAGQIGLDAIRFGGPCGT